MIYQKGILPNLPPDQRSELSQFDDLMLRFNDEQETKLDSVLNGGLNFSENFEGVSVSFISSATPDAENTVPHSMGKIPTGFIVTGLDKGAIVYNGSTAFTDSNIYLKVNVATVAVTVFVF